MAQAWLFLDNRPGLIRTREWIPGSRNRLSSLVIENGPVKMIVSATDLSKQFNALTIRTGQITIQVAQVGVRN